jgi:hypothetical protein
MTVMTEQPGAPAEESRGGTDPDWDRTVPGEELPDKDAPELWDPPADPRVRAARVSGQRLGGITPVTRMREAALDDGPPDDDDCGRDAMSTVPLYRSCGLPGCGGD